MTPDPAERRSRRDRRATPAVRPGVRAGPSRDDPHEIKYFRRHPADDPAETVPARQFLRDLDTRVRAKFYATLTAVAAAPPHKFAGGGYWEAMHGSMAGWYEVRRNGRDRTQHRLFCLIDVAVQDAAKPWLVVIAGMSKPWRTTFSEADYASVRQLGDEYKARNPRSVI